MMTRFLTVAFVGGAGNPISMRQYPPLRVLRMSDLFGTDRELEEVGRMGAGRVLHGIRVTEHQNRERSFANEAVRWRLIVDGIIEVRSCVPMMEKGLFATLSEVYAYAESRRKKCSTDGAGIGKQMSLLGDGR